MEPDIFKRLQGTARQEPVELPAELWTKIVDNMAAAYKRSGERRTRLLDALRIHGLGRFATYLAETTGMDTVKAKRSVSSRSKRLSVCRNGIT
jgi:hypothetical protein